MTTSRRGFMGGAGATGLALAASGAVAAAATSVPFKAVRKLIVRADDIGHSKICNIGTFEAIDHGVVTSADVMLDSPGTEDALERLRAYPWISVGWHLHLWGRPVLPAARVPSLIEKGGTFDGRFRMDVTTAQDASYEELVAELGAQLVRCRHILGRLPDTGKVGGTTSPFGRAVTRVNAEFALVNDYAVNQPTGADGRWGTVHPERPSGRWADSKIVVLNPGPAYRDLQTDSITELEEKYDPVLYYTEDRGGILHLPADAIPMQAWHPGYVDYYVWQTGERAHRERARRFVLSRVKDVTAMQDPRLKQWIRDNRIELVNQRDALFGSREYQRHLRSVGSDLAAA